MRLLGYGFPSEWPDEGQGSTNEDTLFDIANGCRKRGCRGPLKPGVPQDPGDAGTGADSKPIRSTIPTRNAGSGLLTNVENSNEHFDYPWDKWAVFLHPAKRRLVPRDYNGPARC